MIRKIFSLCSLCNVLGDGEVVQVAKELNGKIPGGSVEVSFELGRKWIAPQDLAKALRR